MGHFAIVQQNMVLLCKTLLFLLLSVTFSGCALQFSNEQMTRYIGCMNLEIDHQSPNGAVKTSTQSVGINVANNETGASISLGYSNISVTRIPDEGVFEISNKYPSNRAGQEK